MFKDNSIKKIMFHLNEPSFSLIDHLEADQPNTDIELEIELLPEDLSNKSKFKAYDVYVYEYSFKILQPSNNMLLKLRELMAKKCCAVLEDCQGNIYVIGNYDEPVSIAISNIDNRLHKNIDGLKVKITCESLVLPYPQ